MNWTEIILAVLGLLSAVLTGFLIPYIKGKLSTSQLEKLDYWIRTLIAAAETEFQGEQMGAKKKAWVLDQLETTGLKFDRDAVGKAIDGLCRVLTAQAVIN